MTGRAKCGCCSYRTYPLWVSLRSWAVKSSHDQLPWRILRASRTSCVGWVMGSCITGDWIQPAVTCQVGEDIVKRAVETFHDPVLVVHDHFTTTSPLSRPTPSFHEQFTTRSQRSRPVHEVHDRFATNALHSPPVPCVHDPFTASFWRVCVVLAFMALSAQLMHRGSCSPLAPPTPHHL